jgi:hypothetical protein
VTTTVRVLRDSVSNALDYLSEASLILYSNPVAMSESRVSWHSLSPGGAFLVNRTHATIEQYFQWLERGEYSAVLPDASLLQITYDVTDRQVTAHRLAYVPCPTVVNQRWLQEGESIADVVEAYLGSDASTVVLRSPVRFDYDPIAADSCHPAAHMSINSESCRVACVAPLHPYRFIDFVFRHFYPQLWSLHRPWFSSAATAHIQAGRMADEHRTLPHLAWPLHGMTANG